MGLTWQRTGGSRMAGRILGWLLICDPPEQSAAELAEALQASAGSISTHTRQLIGMRLVEKVARRGERRAWFRIASDAWVGALRSQVAEVTYQRLLAERGLTAIANDPPERRARLEELHHLYSWFEEAYPRFIEGYVEHRRRKAGKDGP
jgi:DNA-binding transcriptional regulator GbsR (MarR family)